MEFFTGAQEIGTAPVDDRVIDSGLLMIRQLWNAGLAHRDVKPANPMVRDGTVLLVDAFFVGPPSPWRQAVDLANMMLCLAVRTDAERLHWRAQRYFNEDDIAEAFAATRGVAVPPSCGRSSSRTVGIRWPSSARSPRRGSRSPSSTGASGESRWACWCWPWPCSRCWSSFRTGRWSHEPEQPPRRRDQGLQAARRGCSGGRWHPGRVGL